MDHTLACVNRWIYFFLDQQQQQQKMESDPSLTSF